MAKEFVLSKQGGLYVSDPVPVGGKVTVQVGFVMDRGLVKIESSVSPEEGWSLIAAENAPRIPMLYSRVIDTTAGSFIRIITNQLPKSALYLINSQQGSGSSTPGGSTTGGGDVSTETVGSLSEITNPRENTIYLVRNGDDGDNVYDEYIYTDSHFELLGGSTARTKSDIAQVITEEAVTDADIDELFK